VKKLRGRAPRKPAAGAGAGGEAKVARAPLTKTTKHSKFVRELIRDVAGFAPYEKRIMELLKNNLDKRALRLAKRKLGTHTRGKNKREELQGILVKQRAAGH